MISKEENKRILITHTDLDGAGCAILFKKKYPNIEIRYFDYDKIDDIALKLLENKNQYTQIIFADITPNKKFGKKMLNDDKFILIDHHKTNKYLLNNNNNIHFNTKYCATYLACKYLKIDFNDFILAIDAWDTWKLNHSHRLVGEDLNLLFDYYGMNGFVERFENMQLKFSEIEKTIIRVLRNLKLKYLEHKARQALITKDKDMITYAEVYIGESQSGLSNILLNLDDDIQYLKCINLNDETISLYSRKDQKDNIDVSKIAKKEGGGGHRNAAGYVIK